MAKEEQITEEQAAEALQQLTQGFTGESEEFAAPEPAQDEPEPEPVAAQPADATPDGEAEAATSEVEEPETPSGGRDDVEQLWQSRMEAAKQRYEQSEGILRERYLRKATAADKALKILKATRSAEGADQADVDRIINELESSMNPESASYAPPQPPQQPQMQEDQALVLNSFLNEKGMTQDEANKFGDWIRAEGATALTAGEQAVARQSLDGFLRIAHNRWQSSQQESNKQARRDDAVGAVRAVQRAQKAAVRAASSQPTAPRKQPASPQEGIDLAKLTKDDVSALLKQSVEQYR